MQRIEVQTTLGRVLDWFEEQQATDLHAQADHSYFIRTHGRLVQVPVEIFPGPGNKEIYRHLRENFTPFACEKIENELEVDLSFNFRGNRYRANFSKQQGQQSFSFRLVPQQRLNLDDLQLPESLIDFISNPRGLVILTGATGQGKSTTARALIQEINQTQAVRIITVEYPIEYIFKPCLAQFEQREVGIDTASFERGIRNAMRQDPNVIFVGEIRDRESIYAALQAAETGHLVITTLHADSVPRAIARIREFYPAFEQENASHLLARNLNAIVCQRLIPNLEGTRTPCLEIMKRDAGVQGAIHNNDLNLLAGIIEVSVSQGMHTFDQYLTELLAAGVISRETAEQYAVNRHKLDMTLQGIITTTAILRPDHPR